MIFGFMKPSVTYSQNEDELIIHNGKKSSTYVDFTSTST